MDWIERREQENRRFYDLGFAQGVADNRTERGLNSIAPGGDDYSQRYLDNWHRGFKDGQRWIGLDPDKTYCSKEEYPGGEGQKLKEAAEARRAAEAGGAAPVAAADPAGQQQPHGGAPVAAGQGRPQARRRNKRDD
jgi:hypothetical protein